MLTQTLRDLERDGLITLNVFPTKPPSVEYRLAPLGQSLLEPMANLIDWADRRYSDIRAARARFDGAPGDVPRWSQAPRDIANGRALLTRRWLAFARVPNTKTV